MTITDKLLEKYKCIKSIKFTAESVFAPIMIIIFHNGDTINHQLHRIDSIEFIVEKYDNEHIVKQRVLKIKKLRNDFSK